MSGGLKFIFTGAVADWLQMLIILIDKLSNPPDLLEYNCFIIGNISFSVTMEESNCSFNDNMTLSLNS